MEDPSESPIGFSDPSLRVQEWFCRLTPQAEFRRRWKFNLRKELDFPSAEFMKTVIWGSSEKPGLADEFFKHPSLRVLMAICGPEVTWWPELTQIFNYMNWTDEDAILIFENAAVLLEMQFTFEELCDLNSKPGSIPRFIFDSALQSFHFDDSEWIWLVVSRKKNLDESDFRSLVVNTSPSRSLTKINSSGCFPNFPPEVVLGILDGVGLQISATDKLALATTRAEWLGIFLAGSHSNLLRAVNIARQYSQLQLWNDTNQENFEYLLEILRDSWDELEYYFLVCRNKRSCLSESEWKTVLLIVGLSVMGTPPSKSSSAKSSVKKFDTVIFETIKLLIEKMEPFTKSKFRISNERQLENLVQSVYQK